MLKYEQEIKSEELLTYINPRDIIDDFKYNFINDLWLQGQLVKIIKEEIIPSDIDKNIIYIIYYKIFDDEDYKEIQKRLKIGL